MRCQKTREMNEYGSEGNELRRIVPKRQDDNADRLIFVEKQDLAIFSYSIMYKGI